MARRKIALVTAAVAVFALAGCVEDSAQPTGGAEEGTYRQTEVTLDDGRTVTCISWKYMNAGGTSCDWDNAR